MDISSKDLLKKMYSVCSTVADTTGLRERMDLKDSLSIEEVLKMELINFLAYLAASDGVISWNESRYIGDLFDVNITPYKLNEFITEKDIYSTEFEQQPPVILQIFVAFDNAIFRSPVAGEFKEELGTDLLKLYALLAKGLIESNNRSLDTMDENEEKDVNLYLGMLQKYIDENTEKHHTDVITGYGKKQNSEMHGGVTAPKKNHKFSGSVKAPRKKI